MKQSLIITVVICLILGESFTLIAKKGSQKINKNTYCSSKICNDAKVENKAKNSTLSEPYLPMVNMLGL